MPTLADEWNLEKVDLRTREAKAAQDFMAYKGYPNIRPLGQISIEDDECWYFYYQLPEGVLELEVFVEGGEYQRKVSLFRQGNI